VELTATIIYDANCKFCTKFVKWIKEKDISLVIISVRDAEASLLLKEQGVKFIDLQAIYFIKAKKIFVGSMAIFEVLKLVSFPCKLISAFRYLPRWMTDFFITYLQNTGIMFST